MDNKVVYHIIYHIQNLKNGEKIWKKTKFELWKNES